MKSIIKIIITLVLTIQMSYAEEIIKQKDFENKTIYINVNSYKVLSFKKRIKNIQLTNQENISAQFVKNKSNPLTTLKIYAKKVGNENAIVTFQDESVITVNINIVQNLQNILDVIKKIYPNIKLTQINETIVLEGTVKTNSEKNKIIEVLSKSGFDEEKNIIDLIEEEKSSKLVRVKLYVVQVDNDQGEQLINDWSLSDFNDGTTSGSIDFDADITSLTGGITAAATRLGSNFNIGLTLNYLKKNNAVRIVNESTLIMKENEESSFNAGGSFKVPTSTTTDNGTTSSDYEDVEYGLNIKMTVNNIIKNKYIDFTTEAESTEIDWDNAVDDIPGLKGNTITTNVLIEDGSTIVLAGILGVDNTKNEEKIPLLGDIPILGEIFTSTDTSSDNNDLVFFMTPEIVDPMNNDQTNSLKNKLNIINNRDYDNQNNEIIKNEKIEKTSTFKNIFKSSEPTLTDEEKHQQRVNQILYGGD